MPVPNKWVYFILLLFVIFLIWKDPGGAGTSARTFIGWIGSILSAVFDFLDQLLDGGDSSGGGTPTTSGSQSGIDTFNPNPAG